MGREVRQVPPNWEHPKNENGIYQPMFEESYEVAISEWIENHQLWLKGEHPDQRAEYKYFAQWDGDPPDIEYYNIYYTEDEATWYQLYETVSEGTPVSPPFETKEKLAQYLAENGDFWYQQDQKEGNRFSHRSKPTIEQARKLVDTGWAMSLIARQAAGSVQMFDAYQQQDLKNDVEIAAQS
ncbi:MAG TPA: hypothetical protein VF648_00530 [Pyrinomonadaceae bacterium]|jgi:hypothetical protein